MSESEQVEDKVTIVRKRNPTLEGAVTPGGFASPLNTTRLEDAVDKLVEVRTGTGTSLQGDLDDLSEGKLGRNHGLSAVELSPTRKDPK